MKLKHQFQALKMSSNLSNKADEAINNGMQQTKKTYNQMIFNLKEMSNDDQTVENNIIRDFTLQNLETINIRRIGTENKNGQCVDRIELSKTDNANKVIKAQKRFLKEIKSSVMQISPHIRSLKENLHRRAQKEKAMVNVLK